MSLSMLKQICSYITATAQAPLYINKNTCFFCSQRMGTWKITAHYQDDEANAASSVFKVQRFGKMSFSLCCFNCQMIFLASKKHFLIVTHCSYTQFWGKHRNESELHFVECWTDCLHHLSQVGVDSFPMKLTLVTSFPIRVPSNQTKNTKSSPNEDDKLWPTSLLVVLELN